MRGAGADKLTQPGEKPIRLVNYMDVYTNHRISNATTFQEVTATDREIAECDLKRGDVLFTPSSETPDDIANAAVVAEDLSGAILQLPPNPLRPTIPSRLTLSSSDISSTTQSFIVIFGRVLAV